MAEWTIVQGINAALAAEMRRDDRVVVLGEDVGALGGIFGATEGLFEEFGERRVIDTAAAEGGVVGLAVGLALYGLRPVAEIQFADFIWSGFEQVVSEMARLRYRSGGQYSCPVVLRVPYGAGVGGGSYQSSSPEAHFCHVPGINVVAPSDGADAAGLLRSALRGHDPVVVLEPKRLYREGRVGATDDMVAIGSARLRREGADVTLVVYGSTVPAALQAAEAAAARGIQVDVLDLRTLVPLDIAAVLASIAKTGRAVVVSEDSRTAGYAAEIGATLAERAILHLEAPVERVTGLDTPVPYLHEDTYLPDATTIAAAIERVANF
jgi:2-oxoisovalerate dehydrogenase E1 component beta subunit